tara:strand:- start:385 stop:2226 length:1842 start_codon:yes stop_codon:yes gene_type:complete
MATNTGIEVTALRPAASAGDFYVRPEAKNSGIAQGLERLAGTMAKKQRAEDKARAEYLSLSDSLDFSNVEAIQNMEAYAHESPGVIARMSELRGLKAGYQYGAATKDAWNEWKVTAPEDGSGIEEFFARQKEPLAQALSGNKYMVAGAMNRISEVESSLRAQHSSYLDSRIRGEASQLLDQNLGEIMLAVTSGTKTEADGILEVEEMITTTASTGVISRAEANENSFSSYIKAYKGTGNWFARKLAEHSVYARGPNGKKVTNINAITALAEADDYVAADAARKTAMAEASLIKERKVAKLQAKTEVASLLGGDNFYSFSNEEIQKYQGMGYDRTEIQTLQDSFISGAQQSESPVMADEFREVVSDIKNAAGTTAGPMDIDDLNQMINDKKIHPDRYQSLVTMIDSAQKVDTVLNNSVSAGARKDWLTSIAGDSPSTDPETGRIKLRLTNSWNAEVFREVSVFEKANGVAMDEADIYEMNQRIQQKFSGEYEAEKTDTRNFNDHNRTRKAVLEVSRTEMGAVDNAFFSSFGDQPATASFMFTSSKPVLKAAMLEGFMTPLTVSGDTLPAYQWLELTYGKGALARWHNEFGGGKADLGKMSRSDWAVWSAKYATD